MTGILKRILRSETSNPIDNEDRSLEYSFAIEYKGPAITYSIPQAIPVDADEIPIAATVASESQLNIFSLPISQPIVKKPTRESKLDHKRKISSNSVATGKDDSAILQISKKVSGCLRENLDLHEDDGKKTNVKGYVDPSNWESEDSVLSTCSEIFSTKEDESNNEIQPHHFKRPSVTFHDPETNETISDEQSIHSEAESLLMKPMAKRNGKKGTCYRCLKGNRFTEKEICVVCSAKYCCNCVIRAMGSMPEGRKCITCIRFRINESRRDSLGKCSRMLKRMLTRSQIKEVMRREIECEANQLPPRLVFVNGERLSKAELVKLQKCLNPPEKLRPGCYWYDKVSGFWGKEGQPPCQIISTQLAVGGHIKRDASNGNTNVLINNREITKTELSMLKIAGVPCEGHPHFWVSADGSYQDEGMNNVKGKIWDKTRTKLYCAVLSLPIPSGSANSGEEEVKKVIPSVPEQKVPQKLLLVGYSKSGTSTIFKQAKLLYNVPFSEDECQKFKFVIQSNLYRYLGILLEGRQRFEEETLIDGRKSQTISQSDPSGNTGQIYSKSTYSIGPRLKAFSDWLLNIMVSGNLEVIFPTPTNEYAQLVEYLWKDKAVQATYSRRNELELLPRVASYFLDRAIEISKIDYEPSDNDILHAEGISSCNSLSCTEFSFPETPQDSLLEPPYDSDPLMRYQLIRVNSNSLGENCKWGEMFEDVDIVLFCVALTDYNEFSEDDNGNLKNKMMESKQLFETFVTHPSLNKKNFLLILNKFDLFEEKINQTPLTQCSWFHDFNPVRSQNCSSSSSSNNTNPSLSLRAFQYIAVKFKKLFNSLTGNKLFVSPVTGFEPETVNEALRYARAIMQWDKEEINSVNENSCTSVDASSSS